MNTVLAILTFVCALGALAFALHAWVLVRRLFQEQTNPQGGRRYLVEHSTEQTSTFPAILFQEKKEGTDR